MTTFPTMGGLEFHHIGVACHDLEKESVAYYGLNYVQEGPDFEDPTQGIAGRFLVGGGPRLELVRPLGSEPGVLDGILKNNIKMYHLAFYTPDLERSLGEAATQRAKLVVPPVAAVAFEGKRIAFLFLRNAMLLELIER